MKRFFTKKSVAIFFSTILLFGFFAVSFAHALTADDIGKGFGIFVDGTVGLISLPAFWEWSAILKAIQGICVGLMALAGLTFDAALNFSVLHIKDLFDTAGPLNGLWQMFRDLINLFFIFILLYIAITKIISSWNIKSQTTLVNVIIDVLLINFSMFFTKLLIDVSNMIAVEFFKQILTVGNPSTAIFMSTGIKSFIAAGISSSGQSNVIILLILQIILMCVLMWVFFYGALLFVGRTVMLIFLSISSPIGFVFGSIPWVSEHSKAWWKSLIDQLLMAPVFMFVLLVTVKLISNNYLYTKITAESDPSVASWMYYIILVSLLLEGMKLVTKLSGKVGEIAVKAAGAAVALGAVALTGGIATTGLTAKWIGGAMKGTTGSGFSKTGNFLMGGLKKTGISSLPGRAMAFAKGNEYDAKTGKEGGKFSESTNLGGVIAGGIRSKLIFDTIKSATGGKIDLGGLEKTLTANQEKAEKNLAKSIESAGPKKAYEKKGQLESEKKNIESQAELKMATSKNGTNFDASEKALANFEKELIKAERTAKNNPKDNAAQLDLAKKQQDYDTQDKAHQGYKQQYDAEKDGVMDTIAISRGRTGIKEIQNEIDKTTQDILTGIDNQNAMMKKIVEKGDFLNTMVGDKSRMKVVNEARANKGKNLEKTLIDELKKSGAIPDANTTPPKTP